MKEPCRNCKRETNSWDGKQSFYGGLVCSYNCDYKVLLEMQNSMPGAGIYPRLINREHLNNWRE